MIVTVTGSHVNHVASAWGKDLASWGLVPEIRDLGIARIHSNTRIAMVLSAPMRTDPSPIKGDQGRYYRLYSSFRKKKLGTRPPEPMIFGGLLPPVEMDSFMHGYHLNICMS
jgi:hypothetical protein